MKVNNDIEELLKEQQHNESIGERLVYLDEKITRLSIKEKAYHVRTQEELADVQRLEELGLRSLFKKVLGNLTEEIEKERKEYLAAVLKHRSIEEEIEILEYERRLLKNRYRLPSKIQQELNALIKKKEFLLKSNDSAFSKEIFKRESEIGRYKLLLHKSKGAIKSADTAINILNVIRTELLKVKEWRAYGKGKSASMIKKKYIDRARAKAIQAKVRLEEFGENIRKLFGELEMKFELREFEDFLDKFYRNLITDYTVRRKLEETLTEINDILDDVRAAKLRIETEQKSYDKSLIEKQELLEIFVRDYKTKSGT